VARDSVVNAPDPSVMRHVTPRYVDALPWPAAARPAAAEGADGGAADDGGADGQDHVLWWTDEEVALLL
jgi:hypothetical protein